MPLNPNQTHTILNALGHSPNKKLGQNFLIDGNIVRKSIELAGISKNEAIVEIGPGLGTLSKAILSTGAQLFAVEKDKTLANYLKETISKDSDNFHLLNEDCLKKPLGSLMDQNQTNDFKIVANLPYAVATPWLEAVLSTALPTRMVLMLQKEAADRYNAQPKTKNFGAISIFLQSAYIVHSTHTVSASCFYPKPKVDSTLIRLDLKQCAICFSKETKALIRTIFTQRRKQIASLCKKSDNEVIKHWLESLFTKGYTQSVRAEEIDLPSWQLLGYEKTNES
ncbi:MAG: Ribosomal RNA small subunit methyltransferase A [Puniceicoccaceae bacterium MED-G32]|nr:MAG: Ribosomal RNA small subunit methyltransferase A [Puniceicoccaceae bacterium MED-G32]